MKKEHDLGQIRRLKPILSFLLGFVCLFCLFVPLNAQEDGASPSFLTITAVSTDRLPSIELRLRGLDHVGRPLDFNQFRPTVVHGGEEVGEVELLRQEEIGLFTIILVDTPPGVIEDVPALKEAIERYLASGLMKEQVDYVALYQVGGQGAGELLAPTHFHNSLRNILIEPFPEQNGPTALIDSLGGLLNEIDTLSPDRALAPSIVLFSDGTDVVSTRFGANDIAGLAKKAGVPIHTVVLNNENLREPESGRNYLAGLAVGTGGIAADLTEQGVMSIWERVDSLRQQTVVRYFLSAPTAGVLPISVSFAEFPAVQAGGQVTLNGGQPLIRFDVPPDERQITIDGSADAILLAFPTTLSWLDGVTREVTQAQLWLNGTLIEEIDSAQLARFEAAVPLQAGRNELWLTLADNDAQQGTSPSLMLDVAVGESVVIPPTLQPTGRTGLWIFVVGLVSVVLLLVGLILWLWRQPELFSEMIGKLLPKGGRNRPPLTTAPPSASPSISSHSMTEPAPRSEIGLIPVPDIVGFAFDVLESMTRKESPLAIGGVEIRIGRSPTTSEITFENDITVSRLHASLIQDGESYRLFDEGSTSGTMVNQEAVPDYGRLLVDGDEIELGAVRLRFRIIYDQA